MKKVNFNSLSNIKTPDDWVEKAINIPQEKNAKPFYKRISFIASAACIVFCCVISLFVAANFDFENVVPLSPQLQSTTLQLDFTTPSDYTNAPNQTSDGTQSSAASESSNSSLQSNQTNSNAGFQSSSNSGSNATQNQVSTKPSTTKSSVPVVTEPSEHKTTIFQNPTTAQNNGSSSSSAPTKNNASITEPATEKLAGAVDSNLFTVSTLHSDDDNILVSENIFVCNIFFQCLNSNTLDYTGNIYCHLQKAGGTSLYPMYSYSERCQKGKNIYGNYAVYLGLSDEHTTIGQGSYIVTFYDEAGHSMTKTFELTCEDVYFLN